jgi:dynein heavy chain
MIKEATLRGGWVLLQNCHLAASWMPDLERIVEDLDENIHRDFRLWLTSMPTQSFPISVLQNGVKMTIEPPQGLRANLLRSYANISEDELNSCRKGVEFRKLLFGFCFFHAIIQDRRKFGAIGWNIPYEFTNEDLSVCKRQLKMLLDEYDNIPFKVLNYLGAEINYGGRVTDDKDVRLITTILKSYITDKAFKQDYKYSKSGLYYPPSVIEHAEFVSYIEGLPLNPAPEVFGLHQNAEITTNQNRTLSLLESLLSLQPKNADVSTTSSTEEGKAAPVSQSREELLISLCSTL